MNREVDTSAEPWPFEPTGISSPNQLPARRESTIAGFEQQWGQKGADPVEIMPPPALTIVPKRSGSNTAPQSSPKEVGSTLPPLQVQKRGQGASKGSSEPPELQVTRRQGQLPEVETQPAPAPAPPPTPPLPKVPETPEVPKGPPPLTVTKRAGKEVGATKEAQEAALAEAQKPVEIPKPEVRHIPPVVYLVIGQNVLTGEIALVNTILSSAFRAQEVKGSESLQSFLFKMIGESLEKIQKIPGMSEINEDGRLIHLSIPFLSRRDQEEGVIFRAVLIDSTEQRMAQNRRTELLESDDEDENDEGHAMDIPDPEVSYSWIVMRCDLTQGGGYINLQQALNRTLIS